ncbi:MAG: hypothetical protein ACRERD_23100 [Candidatus Binatia bacterium]
MSASDSTIERFLDAIKAEGRSSPTGRYWHTFWELLQTMKKPDSKKVPVPLILAASGESNGSKLRRLSAQLEWALENGCLDEAIKYLQAMPNDQWNSGPLEQWERDSY